MLPNAPYYYYFVSDDLYDIKPFGMLSVNSHFTHKSQQLPYFTLFNEMQAAQRPHTPSGSSSSQHLQRGQACITCRRKKMRCDGARPFCGQCAQTRRPSDCEYTDKQGRTYTEVLEERLNLLKARVQELETPSQDHAPILLHDPYAGTQNALTAGAIGTAQISGAMSALPSQAAGSVFPGNLNVNLADSRSASPVAFRGRGAPIPLRGQVMGAQAPSEMLRNLINIFLPHAARLGFALHLPTFLRSVTLPDGHAMRPHTSLLDVISLWALRLSQRPDLAAQEPQYLERVLLCMPSALGSANPLHRVQFIQAEILLALYFFCDGRLLEGRYHAAAAVTAAMSCRFHQIGERAPSASNTAHFAMTASELMMPPARSAIELGERIRVFWSAFILDRCWSVALGCPPSLLDEHPPAMSITTPLPRMTDEYENMSLEQILNSNPPICVFLRGTVDLALASQATSVNLIQVVAAGLFERATRLVGSRPSDDTPSNAGEDAEFIQRVAALESIIANFNRSLRGGPRARASAPPSRDTSPASRASSHSSSGSSTGSVSINDRRTSVVARSIAQAAMIQLHNVLAEAEPATDASTRSYALCLHSAREIASIVRELAIEDVDFLEPIIGVAWLSAARILLKELAALQASSDQTPQSARDRARFQADFDTMTTAMERLGTTCPLMAFQAATLKEDQ